VSSTGLAFTPEDRKGRDGVIEMMCGTGLDVDEIHNEKLKINAERPLGFAPSPSLSYETATVGKED